MWEFIKFSVYTACFIALLLLAGFYFSWLDATEKNRRDAISDDVYCKNYKYTSVRGLPARCLPFFQK